MNSRKARRILQCYRGDASNPPSDELAAALRQAQSDPELREWFDRDQNLDEILRARLRENPPPAGLADQIIRGFNEQSTGSATFRSWPLALAAGIAILISVAVFLYARNAPAERSDLAAFRAEMGRFLRTFPQLELATEKHSDLLQWLKAKEQFSNVSIPPSLQKFPSIGCREITWKGKSAALLCFMVDGEVVHLFALSAADWNEPIPSQPSIAKVGSHRTAVWQQGNIIYVAITPGAESLLRRAFNWPPTV